MAVRNSAEEQARHRAAVPRLTLGLRPLPLPSWWATGLDGAISRRQSRLCMRACAQRDLELGIQLDQLRLRTKDAAGPALHHNARPTAARAAIARPNDADHTPAGLSTEGTLSAPGAIAQLGCRTGSEPLLKEAVRPDGLRAVAQGGGPNGSHCSTM